MVENGHSWSKVKEYTLSEIGAFLGVILRQRGPNKADHLNLLWMANNLTHKGLQEVSKDLKTQGLSKAALKVEEAKEVVDNWKRLAAFMGAQR